MDRSKLTLLELAGMIGKTIGNSFPGKYWVVAEINDIRENYSGHCYLELVEKDPEKDSIVARSKATIWAFTWRMLKPYFETSTSRPLSKGMMILVEVVVEFHELYGLSLNIKDIDPVYTMGDLERKRAETIKRLEEEGIINMNKELPFPLLPARVAIISSPVAAGYEDFIHQIAGNSREYRLSLTLFPALMQGNNAGKSVTDALDAVFEKEKLFDVVVILRGGGSATDLNCFNSYEIASHIAQFPLPVITGIGHERDITIAGMVANTDLKTPTAVAEFLLGKFLELDTRLGNISVRLTGKVLQLLEQNKQMIASSLKDLPRMVEKNLEQKTRHLSMTGSAIARSAGTFTARKRQGIDSSHARFGFVIKSFLLRLKKTEENIRVNSLPDKTRNLFRKKTDRLLLFYTTTDLVNPENLLKKGYAMVLKNGKIIKSVNGINYNDILETKLHDGRIESMVLKVTK
jgi:exodeoxyribonuclease VII large subunit